MPLTQEEQVVFDLIANSYRITQLQISRHAKWLGCHPVHEKHLFKESKSQETTLRKIRQIIRDLRINHGFTILSDVKGYWLVRSEKEAREYLTRIEKMARSQAKAWFVTYHAMKRNFGLESQYFDQQGTLFTETQPSPQ